MAAHFAGGEWRADPNHNQIMSVTNNGQKTTNALLTLHYDNGAKSYEMQQAIQPGDQMWVNLASLIRNRVPDRKGNVLPADASFGTYDLRDLSPGLGSLTQGNLALDGTLGFNAKPPNPNCCGTDNPGWYPGLLLFEGIDDFSLSDINGTDQCTGDPLNISSDFNDWWSANPSIATVTSMQVQSVSFGTTTGSASGILFEGVGSYCAYDPVEVGVPITVTNSTPILTGIDPSDWPSGATTYSVAFSGQYFGTNAPTLTFSPSSGISYSLVSYNDTQIVANITVASGVPTEAVDVSVTNNGYGGSGFQSGGGSVSATSAPVYATVRAPINSPEITVIAWVNGNAPDLNPLPTGENSTLQGNLQNGTSLQQVACGAQVAAWALGSRLNLNNTADDTYANAWLIKNSANTAPPSTITPLAQNSGGNYRLINDFGNGTGFYNVGITPDPCNTGLIPGWVAKGQPSPYMGASGTSPSGEVYQLAEGRIGTVGQSVSKTINGRTVGWIWSAIEFNSSGTPTYSNVGMFPTYSVYVNGSLVATYAQSSVAAFVAKDQTYQLTPSQIP